MTVKSSLPSGEALRNAVNIFFLLPASFHATIKKELLLFAWELFPTATVKPTLDLCESNQCTESTVSYLTARLCFNG